MAETQKNKKNKTKTKKSRRKKGVNVFKNDLN